LAKAEKIYIRALQGKEEALRPDHISILQTVNNLGNLYTNQNKLAEAEKMYIRALQGYEEVLGLELILLYLLVLNIIFVFGDLFL
jgi:tetratricopeptide (TPR) repeat protein